MVGTWRWRRFATSGRVRLLVGDKRDHIAIFASKGRVHRLDHVLLDDADVAVTGVRKRRTIGENAHYKCEPES